MCADTGARHVALSGARLGTLTEAALDARSLRTLVLVASRLHYVEPGALTSMASTLASLDFSYNEFIEIPLEALRELQVLNWLNLQNNLVGAVEGGAEWGALADSLTWLSLAGNQLVALGAGSLAPLRRLAHLDLEGNRLLALAGAALPPSVVLLRLSDNLLPALPCAALAALPRLRHLHLRNNPMRAVAERACLSALRSLHSLDLAHGDLDDLFALDVHHLRLERLILDLNQFTSIPAFAAEGGRLERLSVCHNRVSRLSDATLHALASSLERLELDHNELVALGDGALLLARLGHLSLAYNRLEEVEHLPPRLSALVLTGNRLAALPTGLRALESGSLRHLELGYNRIAAVHAREFGPWAAALASLGLKGNMLVEVAADAFPAALPLRELALSFNEMDRVETRAFANLTQLRVLELSGALPPGAPPPAAPALAWLALDNSRIRCVTTTYLAALASLEYLDLDFNDLAEFPSGVAHAPRVRYRMRELRLSSNYIAEVNGEFLQNLVELQSLDLSYNRVRSVDESDFANLPHLVYLNLAGNLVKRVGVSAFRSLPRLAVLDLRDNRLEEFSTRHFERVASAESELAVNVSWNRVASLQGGAAPVRIYALDLSHNRLESVPPGFFAALGHLRRLSLAHNRLALLDGASFGSLPALLVLQLDGNVLFAARRRAFAEMADLRALDLSRNRLGQLTAEQFLGLRHLRHLRLAGNELRALPRDCFKGTVLEHLDLADNRLAVYPSSALAQVGFTLRSLHLARNRLEYLDADVFRATAFLHELGLADNALTALADNTFASLSHLHALYLSGNRLKVNFKEAFGALPRLRRLALAGCALRAVPPLPLVNLTDLDLAGNSIASYREPDVRRLSALRTLRLARNRLTSLQPAMWAALPRLADLDLSDNPIVRVASASFVGLGRLTMLRLEGLRWLRAVEPRAFRSLVVLRTLTLDAPLAGGAALADVAAAAPALEALAVTLHAEALDAQLLGMAAPRLRALEVRGAALLRVSARAFSALGRQRSLTLRVRGTSVVTLPAGLVHPLARVPMLALDFSNNRLTSFSPAILYANLSEWRRRATKLVSGGLALQDNDLSCGCGVWWVAAWLRRWSAEVGGGSADARAAARGARCGPRDGEGAPLVSVRADGAECAARALSARAPRPLSATSAPPALCLVLLYALTSLS